MGNLARRSIALATALLFVFFATFGMVTSASAESVDSLFSQSVFCLRCAQPYTSLSWNLSHETGGYSPVGDLDNMLHFTALGIQFIFCAADGKNNFAIDVPRAIALIEAIDAEIPDEYKRQHVKNIVILLSSEDYCLHYDYWSAEQRSGLIPDLGSYFTSEKTQQNVVGCCYSFPHTMELERVVWLATGKNIAYTQAPREQVNCAYSYHLYCSDEAILMAKFIHEVTHALTFTTTMPSLEDYGFVSNHNWERLQTANGRTPEDLFSTEALAYDTTLKVMSKYQPLAFLDIRPNTQYEDDSTEEPEIIEERVLASNSLTSHPNTMAAPEEQSTEERQMTMWLELDNADGTNGNTRITWIEKAEVGARPTLQPDGRPITVIRDDNIPLAAPEAVTPGTEPAAEPEPVVEESYPYEVYGGIDPRSILGLGDSQTP